MGFLRSIKNTPMEAAPLAPLANSPATRAVAGGPARRNQTGTRVSRFVFTLNNYSDEEYAFFLDFPCQWLVVGKEIGESGTPHLQGACILGSRWSFSKLKTLIGFKRAHLEPMCGRPEDSLAYCTKEDSNAFVCGTLPSQGKRNDVHAAVARIRGGESVRQLASDDAGGVAVVKFHKGLTVLRSLLTPQRTGAPAVFWLHGSTGVGKTRSAFELGRVLASGDSDIWISSGGLRWFDGYDGQSVAIFDEFRSKHVTSFAFLLRLLDRYPFSVEFKGGFVTWIPKFIIITCSVDPDDCFAKRKEHVPEDIAQLHRRITRVELLDSILSDDERLELVTRLAAIANGDNLS